jgi:hypothetical protein
MSSLAAPSALSADVLCAAPVSSPMESSTWRSLRRLVCSSHPRSCLRNNYSHRHRDAVGSPPCIQAAPLAYLGLLRLLGLQYAVHLATLVPAKPPCLSRHLICIQHKHDWRDTFEPRLYSAPEPQCTRCYPNNADQRGGAATRKQVRKVVAFSTCTRAVPGTVTSISIPYPSFTPVVLFD